MKSLPFSHHYDKLDSLLNGGTITTIRRRNHFRRLEKVKVIRNNQFLCYAQITVIKKLKLKEIDDITLWNDVSPHAETREEAIDFINQFYRNALTKNSEVYLFYLKEVL